MIVTTPEELKALREGDQGRCTATFTVHGVLGVTVVLRCSRTAWHKDYRGHRHVHADRTFTKWPGSGNFAGFAFVETPRTDIR